MNRFTLAVTPFEFAALYGWDGGSPSLELISSTSETVWLAQRLAVAAVGVAFVLTVSISAVSFMYGKKKAKQKYASRSPAKVDIA